MSAVLRSHLLSRASLLTSAGQSSGGAAAAAASAARDFAPSASALAGAPATLATACRLYAADFEMVGLSPPASAAELDCDETLCHDEGGGEAREERRDGAQLLA